MPQSKSIHRASLYLASLFLADFGVSVVQICAGGALTWLGTSLSCLSALTAAWFLVARRREAPTITNYGAGLALLVFIAPMAMSFGLGISASSHGASEVEILRSVEQTQQTIGLVYTVSIALAGLLSLLGGLSQDFLITRSPVIQAEPERRLLELEPVVAAKEACDDCGRPLSSTGRCVWCGSPATGSPSKSGENSTQDRPATSPMAGESLKTTVKRPRCPYCHEDVRPGSGAHKGCPGCMAWHHATCWIEHGGCSACGQRAAPAVSVRGARVEPRPPLLEIGVAVTLMGVMGASWLFRRAPEPTKPPPTSPSQVPLLERAAEDAWAQRVSLVPVFKNEPSSRPPVLVALSSGTSRERLSMQPLASPPPEPDRFMAVYDQPGATASIHRAGSVGTPAHAAFHRAGDRLFLAILDTRGGLLTLMAWDPALGRLHWPPIATRSWSCQDLSLSHSDNTLRATVLISGARDPLRLLHIELPLDAVPADQPTTTVLPLHFAGRPGEFDQVETIGDGKYLLLHGVEDGKPAVRLCEFDPGDGLSQSPRVFSREIVGVPRKGRLIRLREGRFLLVGSVLSLLSVETSGSAELVVEQEFETPSAVHAACVGQLSQGLHVIGLEDRHAGRLTAFRLGSRGLAPSDFAVPPLRGADSISILGGQLYACARIPPHLHPPARPNEAWEIRKDHHLFRFDPEVASWNEVDIELPVGSSPFFSGESWLVVPDTTAALPTLPDLSWPGLPTLGQLERGTPVEVQLTDSLPRLVDDLGVSRAVAWYGPVEAPDGRIGISLSPDVQGKKIYVVQARPFPRIEPLTRQRSSDLMEPGSYLVGVSIPRDSAPIPFTLTLH